MEAVQSISPEDAQKAEEFKMQGNEHFKSKSISKTRWKIQ